MANPANAQRKGTLGATLMFGVETEYGFATLGADGQQLEPTESVLAFMQEVKRLVSYLPSHGEHDVFTANGSRAPRLSR